ncbi:MAG: amidohydrolase family protein, partial [Mycobacteriales bacterium]
TTNAAELLGMSREIGTLEPGKSADLIAVARDPTRDTRVFEHPTLVMRSGVIYRDELNARPPP